jgi:GTP-binding protein HflX
VLSQEHTGEGTALHARVPERIAAELEPYVSVQV